MTSRSDTLSDRVARAQREIATWPPRLLASMQLQGASDAEAAGHSRLIQRMAEDTSVPLRQAFSDEGMKKP